MKFAYKAYDKSGKLVAAAIEAGSALEAGDLLRRDGLYASEIVGASRTK